MPSAEYFQKQAEICLKLSLTANSPEITSRLISMAADYKHKAVGAQQGVACADEAKPTIVDLIFRSPVSHPD